MSGGQDLGNRFSTGSLGYNVGYKNNAGTDIGYLRGKDRYPGYIESTLTISDLGKPGYLGYNIIDHGKDYPDVGGSLNPDVGFTELWVDVFKRVVNSTRPFYFNEVLYQQGSSENGLYDIFSNNIGKQVTVYLKR